MKLASSPKLYCDNQISSKLPFQLKLSTVKNMIRFFSDMHLTWSSKPDLIMQIISIVTFSHTVNNKPFHIFTNVFSLLSIIIHRSIYPIAGLSSSSKRRL